MRIQCACNVNQKNSNKRRFGWRATKWPTARISNVPNLTNQINPHTRNIGLKKKETDPPNRLRPRLRSGHADGPNDPIPALLMNVLKEPLNWLAGAAAPLPRQPGRHKHQPIYVEGEQIEADEAQKQLHSWLGGGLQLCLCVHCKPLCSEFTHAVLANLQRPQSDH